MFSIVSNLTQSLLHDEDFYFDQSWQALFQTADLWVAEGVLQIFFLPFGL